MTIDQLSRTHGGEAPQPGRFRHEALLYAGAEQFVERTAAFVRDALAADEPVMVAVIEPRAGMLRDALGADTRRVQFVDMETVGRNPARIIPVWQEWAARHARTARAFRGVGEPIWRGRSEAELAECHLHEALLNTAFDDGPPWWLVCPYDVSSLGPDVVATARHTHPAMIDGRPTSAEARQPNAQFTQAAMYTTPWSEPTGTLYQTGFGMNDLPRIRQAVAACAAHEHVAPDRVDDLVLVANELACNSIKHGGGTGTLRLWRERGELICEVRDRGLITDPLAGRRKPDPRSDGGAGLWIANLLCDLVRIRSTAQDGTTVRVHIEARTGRI
ncbi:sensor histidine kinase [Actinocrinis puniceicyclus]|uniref:Sensor histidine kinase n=1 Tax=Actinocrinis puniceicyclus TaxID=977794 RepID=A0A8J8BC60_9ACTN|nr:sensor histidine kinase [Actinocrinis puniceicyclus]MBS2961434.1 sensor histidine kinase [Actinocrinis puniceicyclus]